MESEALKTKYRMLLFVRSTLNTHWLTAHEYGLCICEVKWTSVLNLWNRLRAITMESQQKFSTGLKKQTCCIQIPKCIFHILSFTLQKQSNSGSWSKCVFKNALVSFALLIWTVLKAGSKSYNREGHWAFKHTDIQMHTCMHSQTHQQHFPLNLLSSFWSARHMWKRNGDQRPAAERKFFLFQPCSHCQHQTTA